jgi:poly-beta-1,6-N-acetyl-D-glucosamine synthase
VRAWYKQNLRWLWGTCQGIIGHKVGRRATRFDLAYIGMMVDWLLFTLVSPAILAFLVATNYDDPARLGRIGLLYATGYAVWSAVGAIALRKWRLFVLWPSLLVLDWISRVNLLHAAIKAFRQPTAECRWESPARYATAA